MMFPVSYINCAVFAFMLGVYQSVNACTDCPEMVDVPSGTFLMGSCKLSASQLEENKKRIFLGQQPILESCIDHDLDARDDETPQHRVTIQAFQIGKYPVTLGQFKVFLIESGRGDLVNEIFMSLNSYGDSAPVVWVSWKDAQDYVDWLNESRGGGWRLPSEAEWEYACRAGDTKKYCGSEIAEEVAWYEANSGGRLQTVGQKIANGFGIYDMSGNVFEWVEDCWHDSYAGAPTDGRAWISECSNNWRVQRGGSATSPVTTARASKRFFGPESNNPYANFDSFRVARDR